MTRIVGPTGSRRRRRLLFVPLLCIAAFFAVFFVVGASATLPASVLAGSPSQFESGDGNMTVDNGSTFTDWNCFENTTGFVQLTPPATPPTCAVNSGGSQTWADGGTTSVGTSEFQFKSGTKFDDACVAINSGNNPPKDEWTNVAEYTEQNTTTKDLFFYGATIRPKVNGNVSGNVYFSQKTNGCHTFGDILLAFDFLGGGGSPSLHSLTWINSTSPASTGNICLVSSDQGSPCWGNDTAINSADFNGSVNTNTINAGDNGINNTTLPANSFAEFGINLTQAIKVPPGGTLPCFANQTWVSRSSGSSFSSNPEDVEVVNRQTCGEIKVIKQTKPRGLDQQFSFSSNLPANTAAGGVTCTGNSSGGVQSDGSFCLNDAGNTGKTLGSTDPTQNSTGNTVDETKLQPGTYTVSESTTDPLGFAYDSITCTPSGSATVNDSTRTATITLGIGGTVVCVVQNNQQQGAIKITKTGKDKACTAANTPTITNGVCTGAGTAALSGAKFSITGPNSYSNSVTTGSDGTICVDHLAFGSYTVTETQAPSGYGIDSTTGQPTTVGTNTNCSGSPNAINATDTPKTDITATATSEAPGGTNSTITCSGTSTDGQTTASGSGSGATASASDTGLHPGTYTCTIVIDP